MKTFVDKNKGGESETDHSAFFLQYTCKDENVEGTAEKKFLLWVLAGLHANSVIIFVVAINYL